MWIISSLTNSLTPTAVALGNFDGIHQGHRQVILPVLNSDSQTRATVVSFCPHPREFFSGQPHALLTPQSEKALQLQMIGVEQLVLLPFNRELAALDPPQFVEEVLVRHLQAKQVSIGQDFRFGHKRSGTATDLSEIAATYGIGVTIVPLLTFKGKRVSTSAIRDSLEQGDLTIANRMLGRSYSLVGEVVEGQQLGRTIGFPTANLRVPPEKFLPRQGVYGVRVFGQALNRDEPVLGVMNIGNRPTVNGTQRTIEVHLLDWQGDLYGQTLTVELEQFIRSEQKFSSLDELKTQIKADCETARAMLVPVL
ncbi:bifunctional riboflavin kinase/FAD synthetase [Phormidesmis priestleyi ULC007]|uniref:Riboflavin biosynthesis protein n=1 Tax=Phormidesmis priestleyi ULC007 TaxID=1920490 RepID=A0A2T1DJM7_9CYAN|nr:bifunctional riboflavin kinase/FAD synthetase [Phormidesmis priestleyi]PSB20697.1 bifunctional riboflavin kinase/FAD synthetase [Phormidesmis priestleyi ULC007]PZO47120.1 MAG: bifunctional riboflavin kinase/FAD synthetase [Phormidesmis priestleyi]